jgi:hypothetical protein
MLLLDTTKFLELNDFSDTLTQNGLHRPNSPLISKMFFFKNKVSWSWNNWWPVVRHYLKPKWTAHQPSALHLFWHQGSFGPRFGSVKCDCSQKWKHMWAWWRKKLWNLGKGMFLFLFNPGWLFIFPLDNRYTKF